ncbi:MAG: hypothetical protein HRU70_00625 [Phycisphaeraceae bacterium]|nr:MAG: hypothetical protein HRU70_00625 [Phycisphaeraceae bacterium]
MKIQHAIVGAVCVACLAGAARADLVFGTPFVIAENNTTVTATFVTARADWTGALYLADPVNPAALGSILFNNKAALPGDTRTLGTFNAGRELWFNYRVVTGVPNIWRQQNAADILHFGVEQHSATLFTLRIEDMPMFMSDRDYDDCVVLLSFSKAPTFGGGGGKEDDGGGVPAPGGALSLMAAGLFTATRRRR